MTTTRHITWEELSARIAAGIPFTHRIPAPDGNANALDLRVSEHGEELALWIPIESGGTALMPPLAAMAIEVRTVDGTRVIEIRTRTPSLFQEIYGFFISVCDKIQLNRVDPIAALEETVEAWRDLLRAQAVLSEDVQLGLRGELYFLRQLASSHADDALSAWTGPQRQPHDFRIGSNEFEVKTTRGIHAVHVIHGLRQLEPSPDHQLFIFSLRLAPAGAKAGTTLPEEIDLTRKLLGPAGRLRLDMILRNRYGYLAEHAQWYPQRLQLAAPPYLVPVDALCPRITQDMLAAAPNAARLSDVRYRVNLEGLGFRYGTEQYKAALGKPATSTT